MGIDARPFYGMEYLLLRAHSQEASAQAVDADTDDDDDHTPAAAGAKIHVATIEDPELGQIEITAIPLKRKLPTWLKPASTNNRIFHAVNGQVQFKQTRGFFTNCGFGALKDRAIIIIDASRLTYAAHNDVWKSDRESVRETQVGERYLQLVRIALERSDALKDLQEKIAREELTLINDQQSNDLFEKLVKTDRSIANLLGGRDPAILLRGEPGGEGKEKKFDGKLSPTFFRLEGKLSNNGMDLPINYSRPFSARTDAENGYLIRDDNRGRLFLSDETLRKKFVIRQSLRDGRLTVFLQPVAGRVKAGDSFTFDIGLHDDGMAAPVTDTLTVRIGAQAAEQEPTEQDPKARRSTPPNPPKIGRQPDLGLPQYVLLTKDGRPIPGHPTESWPDDFSDHDGGLVTDLGNGRKVYKINYDNSYHLAYRQRQRGDAARDVVSQKYIIGMRLLMLGLEHALNGALSNGAKGTPLEECEDQFRLLSAKGAATTVLAVADHLPKLMEPLGTLPEPE